MESHTAIRHLVPDALKAAAAAKPVEIQLAWYFNDYKVTGITNTTILKPGEWLTPGAVDQMCATQGWTVKMADNTLISTFFGMGTSAVMGAAKVA